MDQAHIIFTGIIAFVAATTTSPMTAIAINASQPSVAISGERIPAHVAWLYFDLADLASGSPVQPDRVVERNGRAYGVVRLDGESLALAHDPGSDLTIEDGVPARRAQPTAANRNFLYWVPRMRDVYPDDVRINAAYLRPDPDPALVAMRFELTHGTLSTRSITAEEWEFRPVVGARLRRALAQEVMLDVPLSEPLSLSLRSLRTGEVRLLRFSRAGATVVIGNTPEADIFPGGHAHEMAVDHHFELYYRLLAAPPARMPIPHRVAPAQRADGKRWRIGANRVGGGNCPPVQIP